MKNFFLLFFIITFSVSANAQEAQTAAEKEAAYTRTITERSQKIVNTLGIADQAKATRVRELIVMQYRSLNTIHDDKNVQLKAVKEKGADKSVTEAEMKKIESAATEKLEALHKEYLAGLSKELSPEQVTKVKDGMTYGVLPITYAGYLDMIPGLTNEQKAQIMTWLVEAREQAMDAESSEKKHWWFGKYKGRINNYLSAAGYDMKKEGEEWQKRLKAKKDSGS